MIKIIKKHIDNIDAVMRKFGKGAGSLIFAWITFFSIGVSLFLYNLGWDFLGFFGNIMQVTFALILQYVLISKTNKEFCNGRNKQ